MVYNNILALLVLNRQRFNVAFVLGLIQLDESLSQIIDP